MVYYMLYYKRGQEFVCRREHAKPVCFVVRAGGRPRVEGGFL